MNHNPPPMRGQQGEDLDAAAAYLLANRLIIIPRFPRDPVAVEQIADWLLELCLGAVVDGEPWTPRGQAGWLIDATIKEFPNWDEAQGLPAMHSMFNRKFKPPPAQVEYQSLGEPPAIDCKLCNDHGRIERDGRFRWCVCPHASLLLREAPQLLNVLNRPLDQRLAKERRQRQTEAKTGREMAHPRTTTPAEQERLAELRAEIKRVTRERNRDVRNAEARIGPVSFLRWPRLYRVLRKWSGRILRARTP